MNELLQEVTNTPRRDVRIDRTGGVLYGVKIIGCSSRNGRKYPNETLKEATMLYENTKVNLDHPIGDPCKPRSYQDRFGVIRNVRLRENDGLYADFRFNPKHAVAEQLLWDAENAPENVGFSHNVEAVVRRDKERTIVEKIVAVRSVDLVADPATTSGLFESIEVSESSNEKIESFEETNRPKNETSRSVILLCEAILRNFKDAMPQWSGIVDETFLETLIMTEDETLRRRLVEDRIRVIEQIKRNLLQESKPLSREQNVTEKTMDPKTFAKSLKR